MFSSQNSQVSNNVNYIEDVFSTYLYTGNGSTQTITNNIDLAGKGGLVWIKDRTDTPFNVLTDTVRGVNSQLYTNSTADANSNTSAVTAFNSNGFNIGSWTFVNTASDNIASWTFRKQPKFFDVVTYTGNGVNNRAIPHNLGSTPGCIIVKTTSAASQWIVYHRSLPTQNILYLSLNVGIGSALPYFPTNPDANNFYVGESGYTVNDSGETYVAYVFAHNAGGFGLAGTDNVISCGTFTTDGTGAAGDITLGYESQWVMFKRSDGVGNWQIVDTMRGSSLTSYNYISPTVSSAESSSTSTQGIYPTATGFYVGNNFPGANQTYVYIAIRRGPMKVPELGTSVFSPVTYTGDGSNPRTITTGIKTDLIIGGDRGSNAIGAGLTNDRLRGQALLNTTVTDAEAVNVAYPKFDSMTGYTNLATGGGFNATGFSYIRWAFQRAPGFFDEVCYTGTGSAQNVTHNLAAVPEFMISKRRDAGPSGWAVYSATLGPTKYLRLHSADAFSTGSTLWNDTAPTSSVFTVGSTQSASGGTYVQYLFATCTGVSKIGSYTGTGALQTINCGFTASARFVLIKQTDGYADWYLWDSARGITSGNDPYLLLDTTGAEVTTTNYIDTDATGFKVTAAAPAELNASGKNYLFLAIA